MTDTDHPDVPEGAALFPVIPPDLGVNPLLLAILHAVVFLAGSEEAVVHPDAGGETIDYMAAYLQRLRGPDLQTVRADLKTLADYAREERWPRDKIEFIESFLADCGVGEGGKAP
jgi:hypothetical protein